MKTRVIFLLVVAQATLWAQTHDPTEIMRQVQENEYSAYSATQMTMSIFPDVESDESRDFLIQSLGRGTTDSRMQFVAPRSINGLTVLTLDDDTRVFFPSTGRVRRITGENKSGSVGGIGGDFTYEDMGATDYTSDYTFEWGSEGANEYVINGHPVDEDSQYTEVVFHVDKDLMRVVTVEYFTSDEGHQKTLVLSDFAVFDGHLTPRNLSMTNHIRERRTVMVIQNARFSLEVEGRYFSPSRFYQ